MALNLLLPAVVFVNIAGQVTAENIASYWPFAMNTAIRWVLAGVSEGGRRVMSVDGQRLQPSSTLWVPRQWQRQHMQPPWQAS
jgi:hypothetical protein